MQFAKNDTNPPNYQPKLNFSVLNFSEIFENYELFEQLSQCVPF